MERSPSSKRKCCFFEEYERLTLLQNSYPLPYLMSGASDSQINLNVDRVRGDEWDPILASLRKDNTLKCVILVSSWQKIKGLLWKCFFLCKKIACEESDFTVFVRNYQYLLISSPNFLFTAENSKAMAQKKKPPIRSRSMTLQLSRYCSFKLITDTHYLFIWKITFANHKFSAK